MKATSLKKLVLLQHQQEEEKRLNKSQTIQHKKAGLIPCLFLCLSSFAQAQEWISNTNQAAYDLALRIEPTESRKLLPGSSPEQIYIKSLNDIIELLLTEDENAFDKYESEYESRLTQLENINPITPSAYFAKAELRLQWAFVYLKFGHEFEAAWNIRQAYNLVQNCKKEFPSFFPIKKTSGVLEVMLGSIPEKYQWLISILGMQGSIEKGLQELEEVRDKSNTLHFEASLLYYLIQGYILQETNFAVKGLQNDLISFKDNPLYIFFSGALAIKNSQSELALTQFKKLEVNNSIIKIPYAYYQLGEVYLHKGEYDLAVQSYQKFLTEYKGLNFVKDGYFKIGICYRLTEKNQEASTYFEKARKEGRESTEADKYAARSLSENALPNVKLSKIRYATDGGYYDEAKKNVTLITDKDLTTLKEKVEFTYRKARLYDKSGDEGAVNLYLETIALQGNDYWYFAPNACLQLGYLFSLQGKIEEARQYFEKALSYKKHEYKNSIDSKAKSALAKLKKVKL